jgi:hypothetical protein
VPGIPGNAHRHHPGWASRIINSGSAALRDGGFNSPRVPLVQCTRARTRVKSMPSHPEPSDGPPNGNQWTTLDDNCKYAYICGFLEGLFQGHCFTTWGLSGAEAEDSDWANATKSYNDHWNQFVAKVTYRQFLDGLDNLYADHRNRKIAIQNGMWIVMSKISGQPSGTMELMVEAW